MSVNLISKYHFNRRQLQSGRALPLQGRSHRFKPVAPTFLEKKFVLIQKKINAIMKSI